MPIKINIYLKLFLLVILPLIIGGFVDWLMNLGMTEDNHLYFQLASIIHMPWIYGGGMAIWFFTGRAFGNSSKHKVIRFLAGNSVWFIIFCLYLWQLSLDITARSPFIIKTAHHYALAFLSIGVFIVSSFTNNINVGIALLISYALMFFVFGLGFYSGVKSSAVNSSD